MIDPQRLLAAYETVRSDLLAQRNPAGHWTGELSNSALSTATAVSALALYEKHVPADNSTIAPDRLAEILVAGIRYLADQQNPDGGWGDTDRSTSNISTTMLARAAFQLTAVPAQCGDLIERADAYIKRAGGAAAVRRRYGRDKTFAVPILANCAAAGLIDWREVSPLPFELACLPQSVHRFLRLPVVSYAIPALVAIGLARFRHAPPRNPLTRRIRQRSIEKSLRIITEMQPDSGGFLEATPLTSFVVMSLASSGYANHPVVDEGVRFLLSSVRADGSWPIDTDLATWVTTLSINALSGDGEARDQACLDWLLACQHREVHPYTGAAPGGWAWTDHSGGVPDVDDTSGALLALANLSADLETDQLRRVHEAAAAGVDWLLDLQNGDGGWPTFCRGWGKLPFDRSGTDLTAHAIRALTRWSREFRHGPLSATPELASRLKRAHKAIPRGLLYLSRKQRADGSWVPLWFGNEHLPDDANPIYGTSRVLLAYRDLERLDDPAARSGFDWLLRSQDFGGGWGGSGRQLRRGEPHRESSFEETAVALKALLCDPRLEADEMIQHMIAKGLAWLTDAIEQGRIGDCSPIGLYFAKLWYYERLYPLVFSLSALSAAVANQRPAPLPRTDIPAATV